MNFVVPAWAVLHDLLSTNTRLVHQRWALRTVDVIRVTRVRDSRVTAWLAPSARESALRRPRSAGLRRIEDGTPAIAAYLVEDSFHTRGTLALVAELLTCVLTALQCTAANFETDMFRFVVLVRSSVLLFPSLCGFLLAWATTLAALVSAAVQLGFANPEAHRMLDRALVAGRLGHCPAATARDVDNLRAHSTRAGVAFLLTQMTARKDLIAWLVTVRYRVLARLPRRFRQRCQWGFSARTMSDHIGREGAVCRFFVLGVARLLAGMVTAIVRSATDVGALKRAFEPRVRIIHLRGALKLPVVERILNLTTLIAW